MKIFFWMTALYHMLKDVSIKIPKSGKNGKSNDPEFRDQAGKIREMVAALKKLHQPKAPFDKLEENAFLQREIELWEKHTTPASMRRIPVVRMIAVAASLLLIMSLSALTYLYFSTRAQTGPAAYHQVIAPKGEKAEVVLSDGTRIWLNSESKLKYPESFTKGKRKVFLDGEAYFDVEKVPNSTFTVNVNDVNITVLGTEFNIKNYRDDDAFEVTVVEGSVMVAENSDKVSFKPLVLKPFEKASISKTSHDVRLESTREKSPSGEIAAPEHAPERKVTVRRVDTQAEVSWKDQKLIFDNETLSEMAVEMSRWYNIPVHVIDPELGKERYTGKFINNENLYQVLSAIELTTPVIYEVKDNEIYIKRKTKMKP